MIFSFGLKKIKVMLNYLLENQQFYLPLFVVHPFVKVVCSPPNSTRIRCVSRKRNLWITGSQDI